MAAFNPHKCSLIPTEIPTNQQIHENFKSNPFSSLKLPTISMFSKYKCNYTNPLNTHFLKPSLKPLINPSPSKTPSLHPFEGPKPLFFGSGWGGPVESTVRGDFRAWSRRRPGSKSKKNRVAIALECTGCSGNRYTTVKRKVARLVTRKDASEKKKEDKKAKTGEAMVLSKYCPNCRKHALHKEVKLGPSK